MTPPDFDLDALGDLLSGLSSEDFQNISSLAEELTGGENSEKEEKGFAFDPELLLRLMSIFEKLNSSQNNVGTNLIRALKPLLSPGRQKRAEEAIELMKILSIFSQGDIFSI